MRAVFVLCCVRLKLVLKGEIKPVVCFSSIFFLLFLLLSSVNNSTVHTSTVWNGCLQDHLNKNKRNLQLLMIEKKIDDILQHWRSRIGLEKKQVVSSTCFPSLAWNLCAFCMHAVAFTMGLCEYAPFLYQGFTLWVSLYRIYIYICSWCFPVEWTVLLVYVLSRLRLVFLPQYIYLCMYFKMHISFKCMTSTWKQKQTKKKLNTEGVIALRPNT